MKKRQLLAAAALCCTFASHAATIDFEDNPLAADSFFNPQSATTFNSGGATFTHNWDWGCCWSGFTYSNRTDTTTAGYSNDRSAITGSGAGGSTQYGVSYNAGASIQFDQATQVNSAEITNTTYAYLSMLNGDGFAKQFASGDFFRLTINGLDANGATTGSVLFSLAEDDNLVDQWTSVDLSSLGVVHGLSFDYSSSDVGAFGINTPTYFAIDNLSVQAVPAPAAGYLFVAAFAALQGSRRRLSRQ